MIELQAVSKTYAHQGRAIAALHQVTLHVAPGEVLGIIGHSGAGKSTLVRCISLLEPPTSGTITVDGHNLTHLRGKALRAARQHIGVVFQHFNLLTTASVFDNVALPLRLTGTSKNAIATRVMDMLARVGLQDHARKYPAQLSGGQKQRVGIARALVRGPRLLLCDEATSALDPEATHSIVTLLSTLQRDAKLTLLVVTHEMDVVQRLCHRVAVMSEGRVVEMGAVADVFLQPEHAVTRSLTIPHDAMLVPEEVREQYADLSILERLHRQHVLLRLHGNQALEPVLSSIMRDEAVQLNIVRGAVSSVKTVPFAHLVVELRGESGARQRTVKRLRHHFSVETL